MEKTYTELLIELKVYEGILKRQCIDIIKKFDIDENGNPLITGKIELLNTRTGGIVDSYLLEDYCNDYIVTIHSLMFFKRFIDMKFHIGLRADK